MKIDLKKVKTNELNGRVIKYEKGNELYKFIADILYKFSPSLGMLDVAQMMYKGVVVEMTISQVNEMKVLVTNPKNGIYTFARKALLDYIDSVIEKETKKKKK